MKGGSTALLVAGLALAGCASGPKPVSIRAVPDPAAKLAAGDLAAARGQLTLGNAGLALEAFRNIQRARPNDPAPLAGIADCYASMGRFDLAQRNYEAALALAPHDRSLLLGLARIYETQGDTLRAADLRREAAADAQPQQAGAAAEVRKPTPSVKGNLASSVTIDLPPARPIDRAQATGSTLRSAVQQPVEPSPTITVALPPARPVESRPSPLPASAMRVADAAPRLERLSRGEVALVTTGRPLWRAQLVPTAQASTSVRWVPLRDAAPRPNIQVLNAARHQGLAASARSVLLDRGWRRISVGDAPAVREASVVYYPKGRAALGRSLAAQFGIAARQVEGEVLLLVLGKDAAGLVGKQQRS